LLNEVCIAHCSIFCYYWKNVDLQFTMQNQNQINLSIIMWPNIKNC
jgi:hypothetical protein